MPPAIRITTDDGWTSVVPVADVALLSRELRRLDGHVYPSAVALATILEAAAADELGGDVKLKPLEKQALSRVLHGLAIAGDLTESLRRLWDGFRTESAEQA